LAVVALAAEQTDLAPCRVHREVARASENAR
jgi:hypothetical protein